MESPNQFMEWDMTLGGSLVDAGADIGFDIGIPGLGLETEGSVKLDVTWALKFGFGIDEDEGFYFIIVLSAILLIER